MAEDSQKIEFNSMADILKRLGKITDEINAARKEFDKRIVFENLITYYKEIYPDMDTDEEKIWVEIEKLRKSVYSKGKGKASWWIFKELDKIDLKLRKAAKNHGYLTKNTKNVGQAIAEM